MTGIPESETKQRTILKTGWFRLCLVLMVAAFPALLLLGAGLLQAFFYLPYLPELNSNRSVMNRLHLSQWVPLDRISPLAAEAVVVSEDDDFFQNQGINWNSIRKAFQTDLRARRFKRGGSTLTQQVVKNLFLTKRKTFSRKIAEMVLASQVPRFASKNRVLEIYLNCAQWGGRVYGISEASRLYFKKSPAQLGAKEGAFLAMMLPNPIRYGKSFENGELTPYAKSEIQRLLDRIHEEGFLSDGQYAWESARPLAFEKKALEWDATSALETPFDRFPPSTPTASLQGKLNLAPKPEPIEPVVKPAPKTP